MYVVLILAILVAATAIASAQKAGAKTKAREAAGVGGDGFGPVAKSMYSVENCSDPTFDGL